MAFVKGPKEKKSRSLGVNLHLKAERSFSPKSALIRRPYPPGVHGSKKRRASSEYGKQLQEKQKIQLSYGLSAKKMKIYAQAAISSKKISPPQYLYQLLELRLDNVVFKAGFVTSRSVARIATSHGHFTVNNKRINIPSYELKINDVIKIRESSKNNKIFSNLKEKLAKYQEPDWLKIDREKLTCEVIKIPQLPEDFEFDIPLVLEFYSK